MNSVVNRIDTTYLNNAIESYPSALTKQEYRDYVTDIHKQILLNIHILMECICVKSLCQEVR